MKNNLVVKNITNNWFIILILGFFLFGSILYTLWNYDPNTINSFLDIIVSSTYFTIFIFPPFFIFSGLVYKKISDNIFITRFKTRKQYLLFMISASIKSISIIFLYYVIIMIITFNLSGMSGYDSQKMFYATNLFFLINKLIKLFLIIVMLQLIAIMTFIKFKNTTVAGIFNFGLYLFIYILKYFTNSKNFIITSLNPIVHLTELDMYFNNHTSNIISTLIFFGFYFTIIIILLNKSIKKIEFLEKE